METVLQNKNLRNKHFRAFLYTLTQTNKVLSFQAMTNIMLPTGKRLTKPTIQRWFHTMKNQGFYYYPQVEYERFALHSYTIIQKEESYVQLKQKGFLPRRVLACPIMDAQKGVPYTIEQFLISDDRITEWKEEIMTMSKNIIIIPTKTEYVLYNNFHQMFDENGNFYPANGCFSSGELRKLQLYLEGRLHEEDHLENTEALKYIFLDTINSCKNSHTIWYSLKEQGIDMWQHIKRKRGKGIDTVGIRYLQHTLRSQQVRPNFFYQPLVQNLSRIVITGDFAIGDIVAIAKHLEKHTPFIYIHKSAQEKQQSILSCYTTIKGFQSTLLFLHELAKSGAKVYLERTENFTCA